MLDSIDEIGPEPADLAVECDAGHLLGQCLQQYPQLERGQVPAEAEMRPAAAEPDMGFGSRPMSNSRLEKAAIVGRSWSVQRDRRNSG